MSPDPRSDVQRPGRADAEPDNIETNKIRQGVTGHNVRYVLFFGIAGVIVGFILVYLAVFR